LKAMEDQEYDKLPSLHPQMCSPSRVQLQASSCTHSRESAQPTRSSDS
jgi:hypothetical protein